MEYLVQGVAAIIPLIVGFFWYGNMGFGKAWMSTVGMTEEKAASGNMALTFGLAIVLAFVLTLVMMPFVNHGASADGVREASSNTFGHGAFHGALMGILVALPLIANKALFEQLSFKYVAINVGYWIVSLALMGGVLDQFS